MADADTTNLVVFAQFAAAMRGEKRFVITHRDLPHFRQHNGDC
jgi:hypothetical protein